MEDRTFQDSSFTDAGRTSRQFTSSSYDSQDKGHKGWLLLLILLLVVGGIGFGAMKFMGSSSQKQASLTPTPTQEVVPTDTPIPTEVSPTIKPTSAPAPKPTVNPVDKATGLDRSDLSVEVQNGSGEVGAASKGSEVLKSFGYHIVATGNAGNFNYEDIIVEVKSNKSSYLPLLKKDLSTVYTIGSTSADLSASSSADARVIIGK